MRTNNLCPGCNVRANGIHQCYFVLSECIDICPCCGCLIKIMCSKLCDERGAAIYINEQKRVAKERKSI